MASGAGACSGPSLTCPFALVSQLQAQKLRLAYTRSCHYGGSLPDVNQIGCGLAELQVSGRRPGPAWLGSFRVDSPVCFGRAPSTHRRIRPGALGTTGWWNGCSEIPGGWCPHSAATPATYPSQGPGASGAAGRGPSGAHGRKGLSVSPSPICLQGLLSTPLSPRRVSIWPASALAPVPRTAARECALRPGWLRRASFSGLFVLGAGPLTCLLLWGLVPSSAFGLALRSPVPQALIVSCVLPSPPGLTLSRSLSCLCAGRGERGVRPCDTRCLRRPLAWSPARRPRLAFPLTGAVHIDSSPYSPAYLSPPPESSWRRSVSRAGRICPWRELGLGLGWPGWAFHRTSSPKGRAGGAAGRCSRWVRVQSWLC